MPNISWTESAPAGADSVGLGAGEIRSLKTAIRTALDSEHDFPAAGGSAGAHRLGSARPYVGVQSAVSSAGTDGRMMWTSNTSNYFHVGSGGTAFIGGARSISAGSYPGAVPQRHQWVEEFGEAKTVASSTTVVTIPNSGYSGKPYVFLTAMPLTSLSQTMVLTGVTATNFTVASYNSGDAQSGISFFWRSIGSRVL